MKSLKTRRIEARQRQLLLQIEEMENARKRSEYAMMDAMVNDTPLNDEDVTYFNKYTAKIMELRQELAELGGDAGDEPLQNLGQIRKNDV